MFQISPTENITMVAPREARSMSTTGQKAVAWLNVHAILYGDKLPNSDKVHE